MDLWQDIASAHMILGETGKGIAILKAHNPCGLNDALIGMHLACQCSKPDEALPFLSRGMLTLVNMHLHLTLGYQKTFWLRKNYAEAEAFLQWALAFYPGLSQEGVTCPTAKLEALLWAMLADAQMHLHQPEQAEQSLRTARRKALHFDAAPNYDANSIRFVNCGRQATSHDDMGEIAMDAIDAYVSESECKSLAAVWEVVKREE